MHKLVNGEIVPLDQGEIEERQAEESAWAAEQAASLLKESARKELEKSDLVALRCFKAGVSFPVTWQSYVAALRLILNTGDGVIPVKPELPEGA